MDPRDIIRGFFGLPRDPRHYGQHQHPQFPYDEHEQEDQNCNEEGCHNCQPPHTRRDGFEVFTGNPLEMERFFSHQMEELMRGFFGSGRLFPPDGIFPNNSPDQHISPPFGRLSGPEEQGDDQGEEASSGSRDFMLKDGYVKRDGERDGGSRWEDGEVNIGDLETMTKGRNNRENYTPQVPPQTPQQGPFRGLFSADPFFNGQMPSGGGTEFRTFSFGQSSSSSFSSHPDGSTEERKTTKDSQGNTKTTVRRCLGDKCQILTTVKKSDGSEEREESTTNMDQREAEEFNQRWGLRGQQRGPQAPGTHGGQGPYNSSSPRDEMLKKNQEQNDDLFNRFFK